MGFCLKATLVIFVVLIAFGYQTYINLSQHVPIPKLGKIKYLFNLTFEQQVKIIFESDLEQYWGPGKPTAADKTIKPFKVSYSQQVSLQDINN